MIVFIIPAYNERENIPRLFKGIKEVMDVDNYYYKVILIDDGSTDGTKEMAESLKTVMPVTVIRHKENRGPGEAFNTGFRYALNVGKDGDIIVTKEADNTSDPSILRTMIRKVEEGHDLVLASCYASEGDVVGTSFSRKLLSSIVNVILETIYPLKGVRTFSSFYRAYRYSLLKNGFRVYRENLIQEKGFVCMLEVLVKLARLGKIRIAEVPMILRCDKRIGFSKMKIFRTSISYLHFISRDILLYFRLRFPQKDRLNG